MLPTLEQAEGLEYWRGGQGLEYWGRGGGWGKGGQIPSRHVASTSFRRHVPTRFLINQCQIITFLILKSDIIENSRIELKGIVCQYLQMKLKLNLLLFYPSTLYICDSYLFHIEIERKLGWIIGGGGGGGCKWYVAPLSNYWGSLAPSSYAYAKSLEYIGSSGGRGWEGANGPAKSGRRASQPLFQRSTIAHQAQAAGE